MFIVVLTPACSGSSCTSFGSAPLESKTAYIFYQYVGKFSDYMRLMPCIRSGKAMDGVIVNSSATVWRCITDIFQPGIFLLLITYVFPGFPCMDFPRVPSCRLYPSLYGIAAYPKIFRGVYTDFF